MDEDSLFMAAVGFVAKHVLLTPKHRLPKGSHSFSQSRVGEMQRKAILYKLFYDRSFLLPYDKRVLPLSRAKQTHGKSLVCAVR